ncbi:glucosamine-6-phosphate deaminase [Reinekea forsetii]|nr:glucosamine-6-phosphate deaminase [Reinekea forsetii]
MRVVILEDAQAVANFGADKIASLVNSNPQCNLGLATGSTPIKLYQRLIEQYKSQQLSFSKVSTFNLDEYLGLDGLHPQSYRYFMNEHLFDHIDIDKRNTFVPNGNTSNPEHACLEFEQTLKSKGGVDLQLLGIGRNGHIGFNEPSSSLTSRTRVKTLTEDTINANKRFFKNGEFQPHLAITMGIGTISEAREVLLLATGHDKAEAIKNAVEGPLAARCPASVLQLHPNATIVIDEQAAHELQDIAFYQHIERENERLKERTAR